MTQFIQLALPIILTYIGITAMNFVDMLFVGQIDSAAIGAVGVGSSIFNWFLIFGIGLLSGMEYLVSYAHGSRNVQKQHDYLVQGIWLSVLLSIPLTFLMLFLTFHLEWIGINPEVLGPTKSYTYILAWSLIASYLFNVFRLYLTAIGITRPAMAMLLFGNVLNAIIDAALVTGNWGMPRLGATGAAWATTGSRVFMTVGLGIVLVMHDRKNHNFFLKSQLTIHWNRMKELITIGLPAALQMTFEVGVFALSTTLAARLSADALAAHQIVLNTASFTFMVPLGIGSATAVSVGKALGQGDPIGAKRVGWLGLKLGVGFMAFSSGLLLICPNIILGFFSKEDSVKNIAKSLLLVAALFQISDGAQTVGTGALRGLGDTKSSMFFNLGGHWFIGLPVGVYLCFWKDQGVQGLWIGLSIGLTVVAFGVLSQWWRSSRKLLV